MPRYLKALTITAVAMLSAHFVWGASLDRALQLHGLAQGNYLIGDSAGALRVLEQCLNIKPDHLPALRLKARIEIDKGNHRQAADTISQAMVFHPEDMELKLLEALLDGQAGNRDHALTKIETVILQVESDTREGRIARQLFGILQMAEGNWDDAAEAFRSIAEDAPENLKLATEAYLEKANRLTREGRFDTAIATIDQAIELYEGSKGRDALDQLFQLRFQRAKVLVLNQETRAAIDSLEQLQSQRPDQLQVALALGSLYLTIEDWTSLEGLLPALEAAPGLLDISLYFEGRIALARMRVGTARAKFESALEIATQNESRLRPTLHYYRGISLTTLGREDEAQEAIQHAIDLGFQPETTGEAERIAQMLLENGQFKTAIPILERALLRGQVAPELWGMLGRAHRKEGQNSLAISAFNEALKLDPKKPETRALRGSLLREIGDLDGALKDYQIALKIHPEDPLLHYQAGLILLQIGRVPAAEKHLEIAVRDLSDHPTLALLHATTAYVLDKPDKALASVGKYLMKSAPEGRPMISETALYLRELLAGEASLTPHTAGHGETTFALFRDYRSQRATRKSVLDHAGRARTPEQARAQISVTAFWMAQHEKAYGDRQSFLELLRIAVEYGSKNSPEWQLARWQQKESEQD